METMSTPKVSDSHNKRITQHRCLVPMNGDITATLRGQIQIVKGL